MAGAASRQNGTLGGRPKGAKSWSTISKEQARDAIRQIILAHAEGLVSAQIAQAQGIKYLVTRDRKTGKFIRVTEAMAKAKSEPEADESEEIIEVWEKDPSTPAFTDLMNRALDKPKEQAQEVVLSGTVNLDQRIAGGRKRASQK